MNAAMENCNPAWNQLNRDPSPRADAAFTEIYELIFYNRTMVKSELEVLLHLLRQKLRETHKGTAVFISNDIEWTRVEETAPAMIRSAWK